MKKKLLLTLLAVFTTFVAFSQTESDCTVTVTDDVAYLEDFSSSTNLTNCWTLTTDYGSSYGNWMVSSTALALFHSYSAGSTADAITPTLDITGVTTPWIKFDHYEPDYGSSGVCNYLTVLYRTSSDAEWVTLLEFTDVISSYQTDSIALPNASATYQICFRWSNPSSSADGIYIDNLTVYNEENPPACVKAMDITFSDILADGVTISWTQPDDNDSWTVYYKAENATDWSSENVSTNPTVTLTGLTAQTTYEVYVVTVCGDDETTYPKSKTSTFKTACSIEGLTLPYYDGFESDDPLACYIKAVSIDVTGSWGGNFPKEQVGYTTITNNGSQTSIEFKNSNLVLVLPPFADDVDLSTARVKVYVQKGSSTDGITMEVGVMTSSTDTSTFESMGVLNAGLSTMSENIVSFANLTNGGKYVAFYFKNSTGSGSYYIDDVTVELIPACAKIDGTLSLTTSNAESATVSFSDAEDQSSWKLFYKKATESDDDYVSVDLTDTTYTIDNLESSTSYTAYVIRTCDDGDELAERSNYLTFSTTAVPYSLADNNDTYTMGFEADDPTTGWVLASDYTNKWIYGSATNNGGEKSLYVSDNDSSYTYSIGGISYCYASFLVEFDNKAEYDLSFDYKCNGEGGTYSIYDYLSVYLCDGSYELPTSAEPTGTVLLSKVVGITDWTNFSTKLEGVQNTTKQIVFFFKTDYSGGTGVPAAIDNISITGSDCGSANTLSSSDITADGATITWVQPGDNSTSWIVYYKAENETDWNSEEVSNDPTITLTGLTAQTTYEVYVATVCGGDEANYPKSSTFTFKTACSIEGLTLPYYDGFESDDPLACYTKAVSVDITGYWGGNFPKEQVGYTTITNNNSQTSIEFKGGNLVLVLPPFADDVDLTTARVKVYAQKNSTSESTTLEVGVMTNSTDTSTFESMAVLDGGYNTMSENIVSLANLTNGGKYIAFYFKDVSTTNSYYIDDLTVELIPACAKIDGTLSLFTSDNESATVNFSDAEDQSSWKLFYKKATDSDDNYLSVDLTDTTYTITDLEASTEYTAYVIRTCDDGDDLAERSNYLTFSTTATPYNLADNNNTYSMGFEAEDSTTGWTLASNYTNAWIYGSSTNNGGEKSLYISNDDSSYAYTVSSLTYAYASFLVKFDNMAEYNLSFDYKCNGEVASYNSYAYDYLSVYLCDGSYELPTSAEPTGTVLLSKAASITDWTNFSTKLEGVQNTTKKIVFFFKCDSYSGTGVPAAIDNISIVGSECGSANTLTASNINENSATVAWTQPGETTVTWKVEYRAQGQESWLETNETSTASIDLTELTASTIYEYRVITICGDNADNYPVSSVSTFRTTCGAIDLTSYDDGVWKQDFENLSSSSLEDLCFTLTKTATASNGTFPYVQDLTGQGSAHTGIDDGSYGSGHALECKGGDIILTLPRFNEDINTLRFKFWYRQNGTTSTSGSCEIGIMSDPSDETTFESVSTLTVYPVSSTVDYYNYYLASVNFSSTSYTGNEYYIAIKYTSADAGISWYWDDIEVSLAPTCTGIDLNSVTVDNIGPHTATVTFSDPDASHNTWNIYTKTDSTDWTLAATTNDTTYQLTDLTAETQYYVYVVTECNGEEAVDKSMSVSFTTTVSCPAPTNLTVENITATTADVSWESSSEVTAWTLSYKEDNDYSTWADLSLTTTNTTLTNLLANTTYLVKVVSDCGDEGSSSEIQTSFTTACETIVLNDATPWEPGFSSSSDLSCWTKDNNSGWSVSANSLSHSYGYNNPDPDNIYTPTLDISNVTTPALALTYSLKDFQSTSVVNTLTILYRANASDDWTELESYNTVATNAVDTIDLPNKSANYQLSIRWSDFNNSADGITISALKIFNNSVDTTTPSTPCDAPTSLTANNITQTTATISWVGTASAYDFQLNNNAIETVTTTSKQLTGLTANTTYTVKVRSNCGNTTSDWVATTFTTVAESTGDQDPVVTTTSATANQTTATLNATVSVNNNTITKSGFKYRQSNENGWTKEVDATIEANGMMSANIDGLTPETTYEYMAYVVTDAGDTFEGTVKQFTTQPSSLIDVENAINILTYPNPATTTATLEVKGLTEDANVILTDVNGRVVAKDIYAANQSSITISLENLSSGVYYIKVTNAKMTKTQTLIKK